MTFPDTTKGIDRCCEQQHQVHRFLSCVAGLGRISCHCQSQQRGEGKRSQVIMPAGTIFPQRKRVQTFGISLLLQGAGTLIQDNAERKEFAAPCLIRLSRFQADEECLIWQAGPRQECLFNCDAALGEHLLAIGLWPDDRRVEPIEAPNIWLRAFAGLWRSLTDRMQGQAGILARSADLIALTLGLMDRHGDQAWLAEAKRLLGEIGGSQMSIAAIAERFGLGERAFRRRFHRLSAESPRQWRLQAHMTRAAELLLLHPVHRVADMLGYSEASAFSRQFKRSTGIAPGHIRGRLGNDFAASGSDVACYA